jgi:hypothetical protein
MLFFILRYPPSMTFHADRPLSTRHSNHCTGWHYSHPCATFYSCLDPPLHCAITQSPQPLEWSRSQIVSTALDNLSVPSAVRICKRFPSILVTGPILDNEPSALVDVQTPLAGLVNASRTQSATLWGWPAPTSSEGREAIL